MMPLIKYKTFVRAALLVCLVILLALGNYPEKPLNHSALAEDKGVALQVDSDGADFHPPVNLSNTNRQASTLSDVASAGKHVYIVWREESATSPIENSQEIRFRSFIRGESGGDSSSGKLLAKLPDSDRLFSLRIAVNGKKIYVLAGIGSAPNQAKVYLMRSVDGGATFSRLEKIPGGEGGSPFPDMAIDGEGNIHIVMEDRGETAEILYISSKDGGISFSAPTYISSTLDKSLKPRIAARGNNVAIVWHDKIPGEGKPQGEVQFVYSADNGRSFSLPLNLSNSSTVDSVSAAIAMGDSIHVVWAEGNRVVYRSSGDGREFATAVTIGTAETGGTIRSPRIAVSGETVSAIWMRGDAANKIEGPFFRRSKDNGERFGAEQRLGEEMRGSGFEPAAISADGSSLVVWSHSETGVTVDAEVFMQEVMQAAVCTVSWKDPVSGSWNDPTKWSTGVVPGSQVVPETGMTKLEDVCITVDGTYTVTLTGSRSVNSVTLGASGNSEVQTLRIEGNRPCSTCGIIVGTLTAANGFTNSGTITLTSTGAAIGAGGNTTNLIVSSGTLTNSSTGVIEVLEGLGGTRTINADLVNDGAVNLNANTISAKTFTNNGSVSIAATKTLSFGTGAQIFNQNGGMLDISGTFDMSGDTFNFNGGTVNGTAILLASTLNIGAGSTGAGIFVMRGANNFSGNIAQVQKITIEGNRPCSTCGVIVGTLTAANGFTNSGTITLTLTGAATGAGSNTTNLIVSSGTLTNSSTGVIEAAEGVGGFRTINANLVNDGTVGINVNTSFIGTFKNVHPGTIIGGGTLTLNVGSNFFGSGNIMANIINNGQFRPGLSPGLLNITGNYTQNSTGALNIEFGGLNPGTGFDQLNISGIATLAGTLNISTIGSFCPEGSFEIMTFASRTGDFTTNNGLNFGGGRAFTLSPGATNYILTKTGPECNIAPVANNDSFSTNEDTLLNVPAPGVLGNDTDDGNSLITAVRLTGPSNGTLSLGANGSFVYFPNANFNGTDSFTYKASDSVFESNTVTVTITVNAVNDRPVALNDMATTDQGMQVTVSVLANDTDVEGDTLTVTSVTQGGKGTVIINPDKTVSYTPNANSCAIDSFTYTVSDGNGGTDTATVTITITDNAAPTITAPPAVSVGTGAGAGSCGVVISDLGTPTTNDGCSEVNITVEGVPVGNFFPVGTTTITYKAKDAAGNEATATQTVTVNDTTPPAITAPQSVEVSVGSICQASVPNVLANVTASDNCTSSNLLSISQNPAAGSMLGVGAHDITVTVIDKAGNSNSKTVVLNVINTAPIASASGPYSVEEGGTITVSATGSDPEGSPITFAWDLDGKGTFETMGQSVTFSAVGLDGPSSRTIFVRVTDSCGSSSIAQATVELKNIAPVVGQIMTTMEPTQVNMAVSASASFTDAGTPDTHTAVWNWGDGTTSTGTVSESGGSGTASDSHSYTTPGVYTITLTLKDDDGDSVETIFQFVVIYDPNGGFVTGGGWINSPAGAYTVDPSLTGKANFGFVSKYLPGATVPTGNTEFQFKAGGLNFKSSAYEWLVVAGARAQFKGTGKINGSGDYGFMLTAIDGQINGGGGVDKFRIKIWDKNNGDAIVYDNQLGAADDSDPVTGLGGGSIVIHKQ
jgi:VCBS repeat-containing protein